MSRTRLKSFRSLCLVPLASIYLVSGAAQAQSSDAHDMKQATTKGMESMLEMPMSGNVDMDFAMMMKMHHEQAVRMAQMELEHGKSPEMKAMATQIISGQKKEIETFDQWLAKQKK